MVKSTPPTSATPPDADNAVHVLSRAVTTAKNMKADLRKADLLEETHLLDVFLCSVEERLAALRAGCSA